MTPEQQVAFNEADERLAQMMEQVHASSELTLETIKLKIAHYEKLVILNAGTLALTLPAATTYHAQHAQAITATSNLLHAWQLLMGAIILSLISNWLSMGSATHYRNLQYVNQLKVSFSRLDVSLAKVVPDYAQDERKKWDTESARFSNAGRLFTIFTRLAGAIGFLAQIATCWAFLSLYYFAKTILTGS